MGLHRAGFEVVGFDIVKQPRYPFAFVQQDALTVDLSAFDAVWASPPCQCCTWAAKRWRKWRDAECVVPWVRLYVRAAKKPYIIENVVGSPLATTVSLTGQMFGLGVIRKRYFESDVMILAPGNPPPNGSVPGGEYVTVAGHGGNGSASYKRWCKAMDIDWMTKAELTQAVPPAYSEFLGKSLIGMVT
tara:strand:+ start:513 stop:1076 length:564 start_codon:yes stop_codon:yes gene_type:complete